MFRYHHSQNIIYDIARFEFRSRHDLISGLFDVSYLDWIISRGQERFKP